MRGIVASTPFLIPNGPRFVRREQKGGIEKLRICDWGFLPLKYTISGEN